MPQHLRGCYCHRLRDRANTVVSTDAISPTVCANLPPAALPQRWTGLLPVHFLFQEQFLSDGMCADAAIHDTDGHNPHAHILLTVCSLDEQAKWQYKTEKEYLCMKNGEERGFTAAEFRTAKNDGWENQYPYKVGKKKVYMTPSAATGA